MDVFETDFWCEVGHFNRDQALKYRDLCNIVKPKYALEIGFCTGRSASCVLYYTSNYLQRMISVDKDLDWKAPGREMARYLETSFPIFHVIESPSQELLTHQFFESEFPNGVDLVTIDGDHSFEGCSSDLNAVAPFLNANGLIVVDDYFSGLPNGVEFKSVDRSVNEFLAENSSVFAAERWYHNGKGLCIIKKR